MLPCTGLVAQKAATATVSVVLQLDNEAIRIGQVQFCGALRVTTAFRHSHGDVCLQRSFRTERLAQYCEPLLSEYIQDAIRVKVVDDETHMVDIGLYFHL